MDIINLTASPWSGYKLNDKEQTWLYEIARKNKVILNIFTSPYALLDFKTTANFEAIQVAYQNTILGTAKGCTGDIWGY